MKKYLLMFAVAIPGLALYVAPAAGQSYWVANPNQRVDVVNMLWNPNATSGAPGLTQTPVNVQFNNGGTKACQNANLLFEGSITVYSGAGQTCVQPITSITITPTSGIAGQVFATPTSNTALTSTYFTSQLIIGDGTDPVFDSTNGLVKTPGVIGVTTQGQFLSEMSEKAVRDIYMDAQQVARENMTRVQQ